VVAAVRIPVIGNGDVRGHVDAHAMVRATGCAAVMIGRAALGAPWIFHDIDVPRAGCAQVIRRHCELIEALLPPRVALVQLKKHLAWYSQGLPFSARRRTDIFEATRPEDAREIFWSLW
jgi:tRNA-dihydrouridine synthase